MEWKSEGVSLPGTPWWAEMQKPIWIAQMQSGPLNTFATQTLIWQEMAFLPTHIRHYLETAKIVTVAADNFLIISVFIIAF